MKKIFLALSLFLAGCTSNHSPEKDMNLEESNEASNSVIQESTYFSSISKKELPYFYIEPSPEIEGIFIYMHGAGGGYEQGMSDELFKGNFKKLKDTLKEKNYLYVTPEASNFEIKGGQEIVDLIKGLRNKYGDLPVYLSGASAGGRTINYTLENLGNVEINGIVFICPALSEKNIEALSYNSKALPIWIEVGEKDNVIPIERAKELEKKFDELGHQAELKIIVGGDHNAPVEQIDWENVLNHIK